MPPDGGPLLVYGANGYTGELVAREARRRGVPTVLAGRNAASVNALADELGCESRPFALDEPRAVAAGLAGAGAVLHCAGPFVRTARPMVDACLAAGVPYLYITGEIAVFETIFRRHDEALAIGVGLVPGVGFDVVPTDALAAELAAELPDAMALDLAFVSSGGSSSRGTLITMIEGLPAIGWERRAGRLVPVPAAAESFDIDLPGLGRRRVMQIPWGDLATAARTTGIPNLRTFAGARPAAIRRLRLARPLLPLLGRRWCKRRLQAWVARRVVGPSAAERKGARVHLWGRATDDAGGAVERTLSVPEGYTFTALAAVEAARRTLAGELRAGAWTPTQAFGPSLLAAVPDVVWDRPQSPG
jgi:saccharopine dehydrogenase (NAD+, L-lysine-forming)